MRKRNMPKKIEQKIEHLQKMGYSWRYNRGPWIDEPSKEAYAYKFAEETVKIIWAKNLDICKSKILSLGAGYSDDLAYGLEDMGGQVVYSDKFFFPMYLRENKLRLVGDTVQLPFKDNSFDIICENMFFDSPEIQFNDQTNKMMAMEINRALKKDGFVLSTLHCSINKNGKIPQRKYIISGALKNLIIDYGYSEIDSGILQKTPFSSLITRLEKLEGLTKNVEKIIREKRSKKNAFS